MLCPISVTRLETLWRCRVEVIKAHELAAYENARAQTSETFPLRLGNHVAVRLTKAERQAEGRFSPLFQGRHCQHSLSRHETYANSQPVPPQVFRGDPPACTSSEAPTVGRIPLGTSFPATRWGWGGGTDADVPTQPASHAPRRQCPKEMRSRSRVKGSASKLKFSFSSESRLRTESDTPDLVSFFFLWPKEASTAVLRLESFRQQRGQPIHLVARTSQQHRIGPWSFPPSTGKQPHSTLFRRPSAEYPCQQMPKRSTRWPAPERTQARALALGPRSFRPWPSADFG